MGAIDTDAEAITSSLSVPTDFGVVFERHASDISRYVARNVHPNEVEDLVADVFSTAFAIRGGFDTSKTSARPWLFGIATNILRHHYRRIAQSRRLGRKTGALLADQLAVLDDGHDERADSLDAASLHDEIAQALAHLRPQWREPLLLHVIGDLSYAEIADALRIPIGTVRSRISRGRAALRDLLGPFVASTEQER